MSAESNARDHADAFRWWQGAPHLTTEQARLRDLEALRDAVADLIASYVEEMEETSSSALASGIDADDRGEEVGSDIS